MDQLFDMPGEEKNPDQTNDRITDKQEYTKPYPPELEEGIDFDFLGLLLGSGPKDNGSDEKKA